MIFKGGGGSGPPVPPSGSAHEKGFSRTEYYKLIEVKNSHWKCSTEILEKLELENWYKIVMPLFGASNEFDLVV